MIEYNMLNYLDKFWIYIDEYLEDLLLDKICIMLKICIYNL